MNREFIPYDLYILLNSNGFDSDDIEMLGLYRKHRKSNQIHPLSISHLEYNQNGDQWTDLPSNGSITAPTYQQVIDWFDDKHSTFIHLDRVYDSYKQYYVISINDGTGKESSLLKSDKNPSHSPFAFSNKYDAYDTAFEKCVELIYNKNSKKPEEPLTLEQKIYEAQKVIEWLVDGYNTNLLLKNGLATHITSQWIVDHYNVEMDYFRPHLKK